MNRVILSNTYNPYFNLALEEELLSRIRENETILYLWQNEKTVVIGRNQNPWLECDITFLKDHNIRLARRVSGGGAVFHDLGNLNFTFITKAYETDRERQFEIIQSAVAAFGIEVMRSGRNDIVANEKKFSGHAFYEENDNYFHHGTLMVDVNLDFLSEVLKPSKLKLTSKGIDSVKSRVVNLKSINNNLSIEALKIELMKQFERHYGKVDEIIEMTERDYTPEKLSHYQSHEWIYGESPQFNVQMQRRIEGIGTLQIILDVKDGIIQTGKIYSDTLQNIDFLSIENKLKGIKFLEEYVDRVLEMVSEE